MENPGRIAERCGQGCQVQKLLLLQGFEKSFKQLLLLLFEPRLDKKNRVGDGFPPPEKWQPCGGGGGGAPLEQLQRFTSRCF